MRDGYALVLLSEMLEELGEEKTVSILSGFSCEKNKDVETFIKKKAIMFSKQGVAQTHLVFYVEDNGNKHFVGYFALAIKNFDIDISSKRFTQKFRKRLNRFTVFDNKEKVHRMSSVLIGQLGKNFSNNNNQYISGNVLLEMACEKVREVQRIAGGKYVYLECEDKSPLIKFYERNGFTNFGKRPLDKDEQDDFSGKYLIQMIKHLK